MGGDFVWVQHHQIDNCWSTRESLNCWIDFEMRCTYLSHQIHAKRWNLPNHSAITSKNLFFIKSFISKLNQRGTNARIDQVGTLCSWVFSKLRLQINVSKCRKWWDIWVLKPQPLLIFAVPNSTVTWRNRRKVTENELICATIELHHKWRHSLYTDILKMTHMCRQFHQIISICVVQLFGLITANHVVLFELWGKLNVVDAEKRGNESIDC